MKEEMNDSDQRIKRIPAKKTYLICLICIIGLVAIIAAGLLWQFNIDQNSDYQEVEVNVGFIHSNDGYNQYLFDKLNLDAGVSITSIKEQDLTAGALNDYDIVVVSNVDLSNTARNVLDQYVKASEDNSVIFLIDEKTDGADLEYLNITKSSSLPSFQGLTDLGYGICKNTTELTELTTNIPWNNMPEVRNYTVLHKDDFYTDDAKSSSVVLKDYSSKDSEDVFLYYKDLKSGGSYLVFTIWFDADLNKNEITENFPYIGYFFYSCYMFLENYHIPSYHSWPSSPVPHTFEIWMIALILGGLAIGSFGAFMYAYKYSVKHPLQDVIALETEEEIKAKEHALEKIKELKKEDLEETQASVQEIDKLKEMALEADKFSFQEIEKELPEHLKGWNSIGIHRQISGFWTIFFVLLLLVLPAAAFFLWLFPTVVFPTPSGQGMYSFVSNFFTALFTFADLGTTAWVTRKFAAYRISEPKKAIATVQCFLWFQVLTGAFQILLVGFLVAVGFPTTIYAHLTYVFVFYSLFQWLGFFMAFVNILNSLQRTDVAGIGAAILAPLLVAVQVIFVPLFIQIGIANPSIGIALGGAMGAAFANFATNLMLFFATWYIFRKIFGYSGTSIFRVDFDWDMFKDMLKFGFKYAPGQALVPLVWTLQVILLSIYLDNYNNWLGYWNIAFTVVQVAAVIGLFTGTMIPAFSEAYENKKSHLLNYNVISMFKWTNNLNFWLTSALFAIMVPLVLVLAPPQFQPVAILMPLLVLYQLLGPFSWMGDAIFAGLNHPLYASITWGIEQGTRALLLVIIIPILAVDPSIGIFSIMLAYIPALALKVLVVWYLIRKKLGLDEFKFYPFKTFIAPALAAFVFYGFCLLILAILGTELIGVLIAVAFAIIIGPFVYFFFSGFFGGWSLNGLEEFGRSVEIMSMAGKVARGIFHACKAGARLSPWREKGNIKIYEKARIEAWDLTLEKKKLANF